MKTINKVAILFSLVFLTFVTSCSWGHKDKNGQVLVSLSLGGIVSSARSVEAPEWDFSKYTFSLEGENSEGKTVSKEFSYSENSSLKIYLYFGSWNFTLSAFKTEDKSKKTVITGSLSDFNVDENTSKLSFVMEYAEGENAAKGSINYSVKYPSNEYTSLTVYVHNRPTGPLTDVKNTDPLYAFYFSGEQLKDKFNVPDGVPHKSLIIDSIDGAATANVELNDFLKGGNYTLYMVVKSYTPDTSNLIDPLTSYGYEAKVPVIPGEVTNGSHEFTDINRYFNISYSVDALLGVENNTDFPSTFKKYHHIYIPAINSPVFGGWYYEKGTEKVELRLIKEEGANKGKYLFNEDYLLSEDITLIAKVLKGNSDINIFDPSTISINGPEVLEVDDFDKEYSTLKIPGASYVWSWDGEEVLNETDETCVINTSKLEYLETGSHTLKVEINYNGVLGEAKKEVSILPVFEILYNKTTETNYSEEPEWVLEELNNSSSDKLNGSSPLTAFCFDEDLSFYSAEYKYIKSDSVDKHIISRHSISPVSGYETRSEVCSFTLTDTLTGKYISRMTTDGQNIYFISQTHNGSYRYYNVYFHPDNDKNNLYMVSEKNQTPEKIDVSNIFDICTAVGYENGYLYVAGYSAGESRHEEITDSLKNELSGDVYDYTYKIIKFPVSDISGSIMEAETVYSYKDYDVFGSDSLHDLAIEYKKNFSGKVNVVALITDLVVKNDCVYAFRTNFRNVAEGTMYNDSYSFTALYKDKDSPSFTEIKIPAQVQETLLSGGYKRSLSIFPLRIMAVRRRKIYFAQANGREDYVDPNNKTYFRCIDFEKYSADNPDSINDAVETYGDSEYGYQFDNIDQGSGNLLVTHHLYQIGESVYEEQNSTN